MGKQFLAMLLIEVNDQLGVAVSAKDMASGFEFRPPLGKIEEFSVADHRDGPVLVENRLAAVLDAHDAEPAMRKSNARCEQETTIIRTAMLQRGRHATHHQAIRLASTSEVDQSCNAAHIPPLCQVLRLSGCNYLVRERASPHPRAATGRSHYLILTHPNRNVTA